MNNNINYTQDNLWRTAMLEYLRLPLKTIFLFLLLFNSKRTGFNPGALLIKERFARTAVCLIALFEILLSAQITGDGAPIVWAATKGSLPDLPVNSYQQITGYKGELMVTSQSSIAYDPVTSRVYIFGGHPAGGSFPQVGELFYYDIATNSWTAVHPGPDSTSPGGHCTAGDNIWDEALGRFIQFGDPSHTTGWWLRAQYLIPNVRLYDNETNRWHFQDVPGSGSLLESKPVVYSYDRNSGTTLLFHSGSGVGTYIYDAWRNNLTYRAPWNAGPKNREGITGEFWFDPKQNQYGFFESDGSRKTWTYNPKTNCWTDKTIPHMPESWTWEGGRWERNFAYPPQSQGYGVGTGMTAACDYDDVNNLGLCAIPIAKPWPTSDHCLWKPDAYCTGGEAVHPTDARGGWQGYLIGAAKWADFTNGGGLSGAEVKPGQILKDSAGIQGAVFAVEVDNGSWSNGTAQGKIYFNPASMPEGNNFNSGDMLDLYEKSSVAEDILQISAWHVEGKTGSSEPDWPTGNVVGQIVSDGTVKWAVVAYIGNPRIEIWSVDLTGNHAQWSYKTAINVEYYQLAHRALDLQAVFMTRENLFFIASLSPRDPIGNDGIGSTYWIYRNQKTSGDIVPVPTNVVVMSESTSATISWNPVSGASGYNIYRCAGKAESPWDCTDYGKINSSLIDATSFTDKDVSFGNTYFYKVSAQNAGGKEGDKSAPARTDCRVVEDGYVSVNSSSSEKISWAAAPNARTYNVYRAPVTYTAYNPGQDYYSEDFSPSAPHRDIIRSIDSIGTFTKIASNVNGTSYQDNADLSGGSPGTWKVYAYRITAVNSLEVESGPSGYWLTIPSAPRHVQWNDIWNGNTGNVTLAWTPNPEDGLQGYRVYRIGPHPYPVSEVNNGNIYASAAANIQNEANITPLAYYVVAVDALGQEGLPSYKAEVNRVYESLWNSYGLLDLWKTGCDTISPAPPIGLTARYHP